MRGSSGDAMLPTVVHKLLPTPAAVQYGNNQGGGAGRVGPVRPSIEGIVKQVTELGGVDWQEYEPAIRRWESIHGPVPFPAALGPKNGIKPAPAFVEWMMALPVGHVDSVAGLTINDKLKLLGNGVVPGQAERAIRSLTQGNEEVMSTTDTSSFFTTHQTRDVPRDQWGRYKLPGPDGPETSWTRATTMAATIAEQYGLSIWKQRQVVFGMSRRPDLLELAQTISGPEDKQALGDIVKEAHIAAGTDAKANRGTTIHRAIEAAERGAFDQVPEQLRDLVAKYFTTLADYQLEIMPEYIERTVIVPEYGTAGTLDNLLRCPDGKIRVGDKKTGRLDYSDVEFAIQMAQYANASAMYNYSTGQYEPMPDIAKDYAILIEIDPETGNSVPKRINIEWGWMWMRTCAEVLDIRKTKHIITPMIKPEPQAANTWSPTVTQPAPTGWVEGDDSTHLWINNDGSQFVHNGPLSGCDCAKAQRSPLADSIIAEQPGAAQRSADALQSHTPHQPTVLAVMAGTTNVGPEIRQALAAYDESRFAAFWTQPFDQDSEPAEQINGVPIAEYGKPNTWPCSRNEPCEMTGADGLHSDGTVCLYGNARPGPVPPSPNETHADLVSAAIEAQNPDATPQAVMAAAGAPIESNVDDIAAELNKLSKAAVQKIARDLMKSLGVKEGDADSIKLAQYKSKIVNEIITFAYRNGVPIADLGTPTGPAPMDSATGAAKPSVKKAEGERSAAEVAREKAIRPAVASIMAQTTIEGLTRLHDHYVGTEIGWTDEMQNAARTRAAEIDAAAGETPLTPMQMIQGATSKETLTKAWQKATDNGVNKLGWTEEMNLAAIAKNTELSGQSAVATSSNPQ